jgi:hypothetical protein
MLSPTAPGLCGTCKHAARTETRRGSVFYRCLLAQIHPTWPKYPPLPVRACVGYTPGEQHTVADPPETQA